MANFIYLASQSPRRSALLDQLGVAHKLLLPDAHENTEALEQIQSKESPRHYVQRVTRLKAQVALARLKQRQLPTALILTADTTVALGSDILGKPKDAHDAQQMLQRLSGTTHRVFTALVITNGQRFESALSQSRVTFDHLHAQQITAYVASGEAFGKAGAYAIQGRAAAFVRHISGSYSGIMGLPLFETAQVLCGFDFKSLFY